MRSRLRPALLLFTFSALLAISGCSKSGPPAPLPPEQAPTEITAAFAKAAPELKEVAAKVAEALQAQRYPEASALLMELSRASDLGTKERDIVSRAMIGVNRQLQEAQTKGDAQSAEYMRRLQQSK